MPERIFCCVCFNGYHDHWPGKEASRMDKQAAWDYALGLIRIENLSPSEDFVSLVEQELNGEISLEDMIVFLDRKYGLRR